MEKDNGHRLTYLRPATKEVDGRDGLLFEHVWPTGRQFLIFQTLGGALRWNSAMAHALPV